MKNEKSGKSGNKKKGRKKILAAAVCIGLLTAAGGFFLWQKSNAQASSGAVIIEAGENEEIIYARIDNIVGNDIDVSIMTKAVADQSTSGERGSARSIPGQGAPGQSPSGQKVSESGDAGYGGFGRENAASAIQGDTPGGFPGAGNGGMNGDINSGMGGSISGSGNRGRITAGITAPIAAAYTETGETKNFEIPVGTQVITKLGVETTFSRLSAANIIAVLLEEGTDNILKIWVVS